MKHIFLLFMTVIMTACTGYAYPTALSYTAHGAGLNLMTGTMDFDVTDKAFIIQTDAKTKGMLKLLLDAQSVFYSGGKNQNNQFVVKNSYIETLSKNKYKKRLVDLTDKPDFVDYQTALLQIMYETAPQDKTFHVFDGKREMLLTFKYMGTRDLPETSDMMYSGPADYYTLTIDITKGKKKGWFFNRMGNKDNPPLHLYFARVDGVEPKVMVKGAFDTALFGQIAFYLTHISSGGVYD